MKKLLIVVCLIVFKLSSAAESGISIWLKNETISNIFIQNTTSFLKGSFPFVIKPNEIFYKQISSSLEPGLLTFSISNGSYPITLVLLESDTISIFMDIQNDGLMKIKSKRGIEENYQVALDLLKNVGSFSEYDYNAKGLRYDKVKRFNFLKDLYDKRDYFLQNNKVSKEIINCYHALFYSKFVVSLINFAEEEEGILLNLKDYKQYLQKFKDSVYNKKYINFFEYREAVYYCFLAEYNNSQKKNISGTFKLIDEISKEPHFSSFIKGKVLYDTLMVTPFLSQNLDTSFLDDLPENFKTELKVLLNLNNGRPIGLDSISLFIREGEIISWEELLKKYPNKYKVVDCWASWCIPCRKELPFSLYYEDKLLKKEVVFIY